MKVRVNLDNPFSVDRQQGFVREVTSVDTIDNEYAFEGQYIGGREVLLESLAVIVRKTPVGFRQQKASLWDVGILLPSGDVVWSIAYDNQLQFHLFVKLVSNLVHRPGRTAWALEQIEQFNAPCSDEGIKYLRSAVKALGDNPRVRYAPIDKDDPVAVSGADLCNKLVDANMKSTARAVAKALSRMLAAPCQP